MTEPLAARTDRPLVLSRPKVAFMSVLGACTFALAFLLGVRVGRLQAPAADADAAATGPAPVLPDAEGQASLEALLREVELAQRAAAPPGGGFSFPDVLTGRALAAPPLRDDPGAPVVAEAPADATLDAPAPGAADLPRAGWSVQVASVQSAEDAAARKAALAEAGFDAEVVAALVDGSTWYRVRVGGFSERAAAESARNRLQERLGVFEAMPLARTP